MSTTRRWRVCIHMLVIVIAWTWVWWPNRNRMWAKCLSDACDCCWQCDEHDMKITSAIGSMARNARKQSWILTIAFVKSKFQLLLCHLLWTPIEWICEGKTCGRIAVRAITGSRNARRCKRCSKVWAQIQPTLDGIASVAHFKSNRRYFL